MEKSIEKKANAEQEKRPKWSVVSFLESDLLGISLFFKRQFLGGGSYGSIDIFTWKILNNPVARGVINLIKDGDAIVSTTSVTPKRLHLKGELILAGEIGDTYTDELYQRQGMFAQLVNQSRQDVLKSGLKFIYGTPNNQSLPGYEKKAGFSPLRSIDVVALSFPLNIQSRLLAYFPKFLASVAGASVELLMRLFFAAKSWFFNGRARGYRAESIDSLPADWDVFWAQVMRTYDFILDRDRSSMMWRYFESPGRYRLTVARGEGAKGTAGPICGYIVDRVLMEERANSLVVADFLFLPGHESGLIVCLRHLMQRTRDLSLFKILTWCPRTHSAFKIFKALGFRVTGQIPVISYRDSLFDQIESCRTPHFTIGDSDNV